MVGTVWVAAQCERRTRPLQRIQPGLECVTQEINENKSLVRRFVSSCRVAVVVLHYVNKN